MALTTLACRTLSELRKETSRLLGLPVVPDKAAESDDRISYVVTPNNRRIVRLEAGKRVVKNGEPPWIWKETTLLWEAALAEEEPVGEVREFYPKGEKA